MRKRQSLGRAYFDEIYRKNADPWAFETSAYEAGKYRVTVAALADERASRALEIGCSVGVLTRRLAALCDHLVATEYSTVALERARRRCADLPHVEFRQAGHLTEGLQGRFDLIVLSEVAYYWDDADLDLMARALGHALNTDGRILLVHWLGETDYPKSADDAVAALAARLGDRIIPEMARRQPEYRLDLWRSRPRPV